MGKAAVKKAKTSAASSFPDVSKRSESKISYEAAVEKYGLGSHAFKWMGTPANASPSYREYIETEVAEIAAKKKTFQAEVRRLNKEEKAVQEAAQREEEKRERIAKLQQCKETIAGWQKKALPDLQHSTDSILPLDVWTNILHRLCDGLELKGVRGPSVVARDISNAARVNKELYAASLPAFEQLSKQCPPIAKSLEQVTRLMSRDRRERHQSLEMSTGPPASGQMWDLVVSGAANQLKAADLKQLCSELGLMSNEPKQVMLVTIIKSLRLHCPTPVPARLVFAILVEKKKKMVKKSMSILYRTVRKLSQDYSAAYALRKWLRAFAKGELTLFSFRRKCLNHGFTSLGALKQARKLLPAN